MVPKRERRRMAAETPVTVQSLKRAVAILAAIVTVAATLHAIIVVPQLRAEARSEARKLIKEHVENGPHKGALTRDGLKDRHELEDERHKEVVKRIDEVKARVERIEAKLDRR